MRSEVWFWCAYVFVSLESLGKARIRTAVHKMWATFPVLTTIMSLCSGTDGFGVMEQIHGFLFFFFQEMLQQWWCKVSSNPNSSMILCVFIKFIFKIVTVMFRISSLVIFHLLKYFRWNFSIFFSWSWLGFFLYFFFISL